MKRMNPRALTGLITAIVVVVALGLGSIAPGTPSPAPSSSTAASTATAVAQGEPKYTFRSNKKLKEHYEKHGAAMGFADAKAYEAAASAVVTNPDALHKTEREDGDDVYYLKATDELVIVSTDGYIRTYFNPGGIDYFNRQ